MKTSRRISAAAGRPPGLGPSPRVRGLLFFAILGYFLAFPNPFLQIPPAGLLMPAAVLLLSLEATSRRSACLNSFLCMFLGSSLALYWLAIPMHEFAAVPWALAACFVMLLGLYFGLYAGVFSLILRFLAGQLGLWAAIAGGAITWGGLEVFRGWFLTGFPWLSLSSAFVGWPVLAQGSSLFGMYGLSAVYAFIALSAAGIFLKSAPPGPAAQSSQPYPASPPYGPPAGRSGRVALATAALVPALFLLFYGWQRLGIDWEERGRTKRVVMAQGNIEQIWKWEADRRSFTIRRYLALSEQGFALCLEKFGKKADLVIWPETAMPFLFESSPELDRPLRAFAAGSTTPLLFGAQGMELTAQGGESYNRVWLLDAQGRSSGHYDKEHLVPFGEYLPPGLYVPFASEFLQGTGFTPGRTTAPLKMDDFALGLLICYEVLFPELAQDRVAGNLAASGPDTGTFTAGMPKIVPDGSNRVGANLLVSVSNDAWFGKSSAPFQHLQLAAQRCIEQGRYMARATNTGISAVIDPAGRIRGASPLFTTWAQAEEVVLLTETTFYHDWYGVVNGMLWLAPLTFLALAVRKKRLRKKLAIMREIKNATTK